MKMHFIAPKSVLLYKNLIFRQQCLPSHQVTISRMPPFISINKISTRNHENIDYDDTWTETAAMKGMSLSDPIYVDVLMMPE